MQNERSPDETDWISVIGIIGVFLIATLAMRFGWLLW
jgi:hypothetical protein